MQIDLNRLHIFYHIYTLNSVIRAAKRLHLSQPAVSQHLKKLESEIQAKLFTRVHKKLIPTAAGHKLYTSIQPFISTLPNLLTTIKSPGDTPSGTLRLGSPYEFGQEYLPHICHGFCTLYPEVRFNIKLSESASILSLLETGELDFAIIDDFFFEEKMVGAPEVFSIDPLVEEELVLVCSDSYYEQHIQGDHSFATLSRLDYISDEHDHNFLRNWFSHHFGNQSFSPKVIVTVESHRANLTCVKLGLGVTLTSSHFVWDEIREGTLISIKMEKPPVMNKIALIQLQDKIPTLTEKTFQGYIHHGLKEAGILKKFSGL